APSPNGWQPRRRACTIPRPISLPTTCPEVPRPMPSRLFPHPGISAFLTLFWLVLADSWTLGSLVLGAVLATAIPLLTAPWWPGKPRLKRPLALLPYLGIVLWDVVVSS